MILLDTNVPIYASDVGAPFCRWARETIADAVAGDGAAINAVSLAEICVGDAFKQTVTTKGVPDREREEPLKRIAIDTAVCTWTACMQRVASATTTLPKSLNGRRTRLPFQTCAPGRT